MSQLTLALSLHFTLWFFEAFKRNSNRWVCTAGLYNNPLLTKLSGLLMFPEVLNLFNFHLWPVYLNQQLMHIPLTSTWQPFKAVVRTDQVQVRGRQVYARTQPPLLIVATGKDLSYWRLRPASQIQPVSCRLPNPALKSTEHLLLPITIEEVLKATGDVSARKKIEPQELYSRRDTSNGDLNSSKMKGRRWFS